MRDAITSFTPLLRRLDGIVNGWRRLVARACACDSYHPERHYMRGPGPKWHARHRTGSAAI
jgi:hypothetical protein